MSNPDIPPDNKLNIIISFRFSPKLGVTRDWLFNIVVVNGVLFACSHTTQDNDTAVECCYQGLQEFSEAGADEDQLSVIRVPREKKTMCSCVARGASRGTESVHKL